LLAPTNFIKQVIHADRIVVTSKRSNEFPFPVRDLTISGDKMKRIVKAISQLRSSQFEGLTSSACDCQLQFFKGTNILAVANIQDEVIRWDAEYIDHTGTLKTVYQEWENRVIPLLEKWERERVGEAKTQ
jgi:hypothetical protein